MLRMSPEERSLLERTLKLSEENNRMLRKIRTAARWGIVWGIIKFLIVVIPLILGLLYLEPYLGPVGQTLKDAQGLIQRFK